jgi:hypothetical protein
MKKLLYPLLILAVFGCKPKTSVPVKVKSAAELKAEYLQKALASDEYKNAYMNINRVKGLLDSAKENPRDTVAAIFVYNNSIATANKQTHTVAQVKEGMKNDTAYLKAVQLKVAADLATADSAKMKH